MSIALYVSPPVDFTAVASLLKSEGLDVAGGPLAPGDPLGTAPGSAGHAVFVTPTQGVVALGETVAILRDRLGAESSLIVCAPQPSHSDLLCLEEYDVSLVTPSSWEPRAVADRILGDLILAGAVPNNLSSILQGGTLSMRELYTQVKEAASHSDPVLVLGETGTGKDLVAREIHRLSRCKGKYVALNCAALPSELFESELFGHKRGAFTGASETREGLLAKAADGTALLDEIGDLTLTAQTKLLRVLEQGELRSVGSDKWTKMTARIVCATNRDLEQARASGRFRDDLYYRLSGNSLRLPPLRDRRADISVLAQHFLKELVDERLEQNPATEGENPSHGAQNLTTIPNGTLDCLFRHSWPGNVRELRSAIRNAARATGSVGGSVSKARLLNLIRLNTPARAGRTIPFDPSNDKWQDVVDRAQDLYLRAVMEVTGGNKLAAAKQANLSRSQFYEKLKESRARAASSEEAEP